MAKVRLVAALVVGLSPSLGGCSFIRDLAIDAFIPEARPLIDTLRKQEPAAPEPEIVLPAAPPPPVSPAPLPPVVEARPAPVPPPKPKSILSPDDEAERRAIEAYEERLEEIRKAIQSRTAKP